MLRGVSVLAHIITVNNNEGGIAHAIPPFFYIVPLHTAVYSILGEFTNLGHRLRIFLAIIFYIVIHKIIMY